MTELSLEGGIEIFLPADDRPGDDVEIVNRRPLELVRRLEGLAPDEALCRLTALYSVCRIAQGVAGCRAVEGALGLAVAPADELARELLLAGETLLEHTTKELLFWPGLRGERPANLHAVRTLREALADLHEELYPDGDWMRPGGGRRVIDGARTEARLAKAEAALDEARLLVPLDAADWRAWVAGARGPVAGLLRWLEENEWSGRGASAVTLLEPLAENALEARLAADADGSFVARPEWRGAPRETGPLVRRRQERVLLESVARTGAGLGTRFLAQAVDATRSWEQSQSLAAELCAAPRASASGPTELVAGEQSGLAGTGVGLGLVEAARGQLVHRVEIADGRIVRYQILAPTEWNFHPRGSLAEGLRGASDGPQGEQLARLLAAALDPCVSCRVERRTSVSSPPNDDGV